MRKQLFMLFLLVGTSIYSYSQITFQKSIGGAGTDYARSVQQTSDGGYILSGYGTSFGSGDFGIFLVKFDSTGNTLWAKSFYGTAGCEAFSVQQTSDGGYIIGGFTTDNDFDIYLIKVDTNGNLLWSKSYGSALFFKDEGFSVKQTNDGGYIIVGGTGGSTDQVFLIKTDANGNKLWTRTYGGSNDEYGFSVSQTTEGGYIITGHTRSFGPGNYNVLLIKTDANGNAIWSKAYGGSSLDIGYSVEQTSDGGYIIAGETQSYGAGGLDAYLLKTDSIGNLLWSKTFGSTSKDYLKSVKQTSDGGYIMTGTYSQVPPNIYKVYLIKTDSFGDSLWTKTFGGVSWDFGYSVQQTSDGGYIIGASEYSFGGGGGDDAYLIKTDSNGNSGCNQVFPTTLISTPSTQTATSSIPFGSPLGIMTITSPVVGTGVAFITLCSSIGINDVTQRNNLIIFPNPSLGNFSITFEKAIKNGSVELINIFGESVFFANLLNESKTNFTLKTHLVGIYFVKVFDGESYYSKKIIIE